jgi:hypothetical protein
VAAIAQGLLGGGEGRWRLTAVDVDGLDLALGETVLRLNFGSPGHRPRSHSERADSCRTIGPNAQWCIAITTSISAFCDDSGIASVEDRIAMIA